MLLHDEQQLITLAYISDIFSKLNEVTKFLQGKTTTIFVIRDKIIALKTLLWWVHIACVNDKYFKCFHP